MTPAAGVGGECRFELGHQRQGQVVGGLIEEEHVGLLRDTDGQHEPPLLADAQRHDRAVRVPRCDQAQLVQRNGLGAAGARQIAVGLRGGARRAAVARIGHVHLLREEADPDAGMDLQRAGIRPQEPSRNPGQGGLAAAFGAVDEHALAAADRQGDRCQSASHGDAGGTEQRRRSVHRRCGRCRCAQPGKVQLTLRLPDLPPLEFRQPQPGVIDAPRHDTRVPVGVELRRKLALGAGRRPGWPSAAAGVRGPGDGSKSRMLVAVSSTNARSWLASSTGPAQFRNTLRRWAVAASSRWWVGSSSSSTSGARNNSSASARRAR